jgi:hypothetical protein
MMKRILTALFAVACIGFISSCKPKEKCPAYGKYQPAKQQQHS